MRRATSYRFRLPSQGLHFYPRSPCGERLSISAGRECDTTFLSTLSLRRATFNWSLTLLNRNISIHALLAESDTSSCTCWLLHYSISIHALLAESDTSYTSQQITLKKFLSTLSLRRATVIIANAPVLRRYFYPRSPCGERLNAHLYYHSRGLFLSTLSLRRATSKASQTAYRLYISIHALLAESDGDLMSSRGINIQISIHALLAESDI